MEQAAAYVHYALENPALFRLMFGPKRLGTHSELTAAATPPMPCSRQGSQRALGCCSLVHGLASLFLEGRIGDKTAAPEGDVTRRVAEAMLGP